MLILFLIVFVVNIKYFSFVFYSLLFSFTQGISYATRDEEKKARAFLVTSVACAVGGVVFASVGLIIIVLVIYYLT